MAGTKDATFTNGIKKLAYIKKEYGTSTIVPLEDIMIK